LCLIREGKGRVKCEKIKSKISKKSYQNCRYNLTVLRKRCLKGEKEKRIVKVKVKRGDR